MVRAFIAVGFSEDVRRRIERFVTPLRSAPTGVKWVEPENIHMTLRFLGEISDVERAKELMKRHFQGARSASLQIKNVGKFPERGNDVRVVWVGIQGDLPALQSLWERAQAAARELGLGEDDHGFSPHVTVGRVKTRGDIGRRLADVPPADFGSHVVDRVILFESRLSPKGPTYTELFVVPLA